MSGSPERPAASKRKRRQPRRAAELGIDDDLYEALLASQDGHCALCPTRPKTRRLHVDHDHATGEVRGLLCYACNRTLTTRVTPEWCLKAALYLNHGQPFYFGPMRGDGFQPWRLEDQPKPEPSRRSLVPDVPDQWLEPLDQWADAR